MKFVTVGQIKRELLIPENNISHERWLNENIPVAKALIEAKLEAKLVEDLDDTLDNESAVVICPLINRVATVLVSDWFDSGTVETNAAIFSLISHLMPTYSQ